MYWVGEFYNDEKLSGRRLTFASTESSISRFADFTLKTPGPRGPSSCGLPDLPAASNLPYVSCNP
jgi:hypothetical protein